MLRKIFPKTLLFRSLLIVVAPIILIQIVVGGVFFDSIWYKTNRGLVRSAANEINTFLALYPDFKQKNKTNELINIYKDKSGLIISIKKETQQLPSVETVKWYSLYDKIVLEEFTDKIKNPYWHNVRFNSSFVQVLVLLNKNEVIEFLVPKSKIRSTSGRIFALWITVPSLIFLFVSIIFLRNQIRPIVHLSQAVEKFGKGQFDSDFKVSGAVEIRRASYEFEKMKRRILKHISQRTAMLSGISHDLKTPLTRLKLQIELLNKNQKLNSLKEEITEMEKMINEYLDFASNQYSQPAEKFNIVQLIQNLIDKNFKKNIKIKSPKNLIFSGRKNLIRRCIANIINNSQKYAENISITCKKMKNAIQINIDDDGPGIADEHKEKVFRPFYRVDKSRSLKDNNVGLGLSIVEDIVNSHGGTVKLLNNPKGKGLRVSLSFPN
ncbi:MAG: sensor histidine kinase [Proteobacteria bacterium]|jgi:two-component system osmolarity sensor histidine kinase EnvZ|nr:sensor histidine kinase [Candidatus Fonsibacter sp. PEL4]NBZ97289.1 sensor histidine kinase [Candidatus Fonsibacter sp. PEL4]